MNIIEQIRTLPDDTNSLIESINFYDKVYYAHPKEVETLKEAGIRERVKIEVTDLKTLAESHERLLTAAKDICRRQQGFSLDDQIHAVFRLDKAIKQAEELTK